MGELESTESKWWSRDVSQGYLVSFLWLVLGHIAWTLWPALPRQTLALISSRASLVAQMLKSPPAMQETWVQSLHWKGLLEKEMATYSSILAWRIPWTEEPGGLQCMGSQSWTQLSIVFCLTASRWTVGVAAPQAINETIDWSTSIIWISQEFQIWSSTALV